MAERPGREVRALVSILEMAGLEMIRDIAEPRYQKSTEPRPSRPRSAPRYAWALAACSPRIQYAVVIDRDELAAARWFTRAELVALPDGVELPRRDSIARSLIDAWIAAR